MADQFVVRLTGDPATDCKTMQRALEACVKENVRLGKQCRQYQERLAMFYRGDKLPSGAALRHTFHVAWIEGQSAFVAISDNDRTLRGFGDSPEGAIIDLQANLFQVNGIAGETGIVKAGG